jgi:hypothetical protein
MIQPGLHKPRTYFYPYDHAVPDVRSLDQIGLDHRRLVYK